MFSVNAALCRGHSCSLCVNDVPTVFGWDENSKAKVKRQPGKYEERAVLAAMNNCPTKAIKEVDIGVIEQPEYIE